MNLPRLDYANPADNALLFDWPATVTSAGRGWNEIFFETRSSAQFATIEHQMVNHYLMVRTGGPALAYRKLDARTHAERQRRGSTAYVPNGCTHAVEYPGTMGCLSLLTLPDHLISEVATELGYPSFSGVERPAVRADSLVLAIAEQISAELGEGNPHGRIYGETMARALAAHIVRNYGAASLVRSHRKASTPSLLESRLCEYITAHIDKPIGLADLGAQVGLSPFQLCRAFRAANGVSPHQYILEVRVERAAALLRDDGLSIAEIAAMTGFSDQSALGRHFKKRHGVSPAAWRLQCRQAKIFAVGTFAHVTRASTGL
jgi:AraC family transcriptional regulator